MTDSNYSYTGSREPHNNTVDLLKSETIGHIVLKLTHSQTYVFFFFAKTMIGTSSLCGGGSKLCGSSVTSFPPQGSPSIRNRREPSSAPQFNLCFIEAMDMFIYVRLDICICIRDNIRMIRGLFVWEVCTENSNEEEGDSGTNGQ